MDRGVEQLVARRAHNPKVAGSSPATATKARAKMKGSTTGWPFFCSESLGFALNYPLLAEDSVVLG